MVTDGDTLLICKRCGAEFLFTAHERELFARRGHYNEPRRCPECRKQGEATPCHNGSAPRACAGCGESLDVAAGVSLYCATCFEQQSLLFEAQTKRQLNQVDVLQAELEQLHAQAEERGRLLQRREIEIRKLESRVGSLEADLAESQQQKRELQAALSSLELQLDNIQLRARVAGLEEQVSAVDSLRSELVELRGETRQREQQWLARLASIENFLHRRNHDGLLAALRAWLGGERGTEGAASR